MKFTGHQKGELCIDFNQESVKDTTYAVMGKVKIPVGTKDAISKGNTVTSDYNAKLAYVLNHGNGIYPWNDGRDQARQGAVWLFMNDWKKQLVNEEGFGWMSPIIMTTSFDDNSYDVGNALLKDADTYANKLGKVLEGNYVSDATDKKNLTVKPEKDSFIIGPFKWKSKDGNFGEVDVSSGDTHYDFKLLDEKYNKITEPSWNENTKEYETVYIKVENCGIENVR